MVITVEPGFYSQAFNPDIPEEFRQIGIRVEDDVLVTEDGYENLSIDTIKEVADVEAMVQSGK
jgi:Xaa-Pro aminopeptidase